MLKRSSAVFLATAIGIAAAGDAGAQSPGEPAASPPAAAPAAPGGTTTSQAGDQPASVEDCLTRLNAVINEALTLNLSGDKVDKAETALATMEQSCIAENFAEASATERDIRRIIAEQGGAATDGK